ncbi:Uncharacterized protein conserved in bacteria [Raoultella ornithinolytica]|nr:Uncharacterized protein conserved in bacteria [Raoultella ornithinolytica]
MKYQDVLQDLLLNDPIRMKALYAVQALELSDGWIGAGLVRDAVWDHLHGYGQRPSRVMWMLSGSTRKTAVQLLIALWKRRSAGNHRSLTGR